MNILYNRKLAAGIAAVVVLGSILLGGSTSLSRERVRVETMFTAGTEGDGLSIYNDVEARCSSAANLITVGSRYLPANDPDQQALQDAVSAVGAAQSISERSTANDTLTTAADAYYTKLISCALSDSDAKWVSAQYTEIRSRNQTISHDGFNTQAAAFNQMRSRFPTSLIALVGSVDPIELFR